MINKIFKRIKFNNLKNSRRNSVMQKQQNPIDQQPIKKMSKFEQLRNQIDPLTKQKWENEQNLIRKLIVEKNDFKWDIDTLDLVAGVDLSASKNHPDYACVALIVYSIKNKNTVYEDCRIIEINQPYIPGFLAFREVPPLYAMFQYLKNTKPQFYPQLILLDGNGILHCNYCGLASHLGVLLDVPTVGAGKTLFLIDGLTKDRVKQQCEKQIIKSGDFSLLKGDSGRVWGAALRNTEGAKNPIFISIGTKIELQLAIEIVKKLSLYRVVQPIRLADKKSREIIEKIDFSKQVKEKIERFDMVYLEDLKKI